MQTTLRSSLMAAAGIVLGSVMGAAGSPPAMAESVIRAAMHAGVSGIDPIWTTANIAAYHGAMVYDTLFGVDADEHPQPQMVDTFSLSDDKLTWRFHLRPGLHFSDGSQVTSKDCIASIVRWGKRDAAGQMLAGKTAGWTAIDDSTFELKLTEPYALVLESLGKNDTMVPFIMREREAMTDPNTQIKEVVGSGPFLFQRDEWNPGNRAVYVKNPAYVPRTEPAGGMAGGKVVRVDRVELLSIPDATTAHQALVKGEIDFLEIVNLDLLQMLKIPAIKVEAFDTKGYRGVLRMNFIQPPFDNPKARQAMLWLVDQEAYMQAVIGDSDYWQTCGSIFSCGSTNASDVGTEWVKGHSVEKARALFKEAGYDGRPVVILDPTDVSWYHTMAQVTGGLLKEAGINTQIVAMDWATMVQRRGNKSAPDQGGWNIFHTGYGGTPVLGPAGFSAMPASCEKAWFGWPCDPRMEVLRDAWSKAPAGPERHAVMDKISAVNFEDAIVVPTGQWTKPVAYRTNLSGWVKLPEIIPFWNVEKK